jgi:O-antigen/teichoic acid export membrane protein
MSDVSLRRLVVKNTAILAASQAVVMASQLATTVILSRHLGAEGFGQYSYVFAFYTLFLAVNDLGISTVALREVARERDRAGDIISALQSLRLLLAVASMVAAWAIVACADLAPTLRLPLALFSLILPLTALQLPLTVFRADLKPEYPAVAGSVSRVLGVALVSALAWLGAGVLAMIAAYLMTETLYTAVSLRAVRRFVRVSWRVDRAIWVGALRAGLVVGLINFCATWINRLDFLMLERMADLTQVGLYAAAYRVTNAVEALPLLMMGSIFPLLSRYRDNRDRLGRIYRQSLLALAGLGVAVGLGLTALAPTVVRVLFGAGYQGATAPLRVLVWSSVCVYGFLTSNNLLLGLGRERRLLVLYAVGAAFNLGLNLLWIPRWGVTGAALATTTSYAVVLVGATVSAVSLVVRPVRSPVRTGTVQAGS